MGKLTATLLLLVVVAAGAGAWSFSQWLHGPLAISGDTRLLVVPQGGSLGGVAADLAADGTLRHPLLLRVAGRVTGQAGRIHAGEYQLLPGTTPASLLDQLVAGSVVLHRFTLVEGWTVRQLLEALDREPALDRTLVARDAESLARALGIPEPSAEGVFLPETYRFPRGTTDRELLGWAYAAMQDELARAWNLRDPEIPLGTPYDLLVLASIVERETALASERSRIAGVFVRRLRRGMPLQTDPTVIYGLGTAFDGNLTRRHLETDTPFNTYTRTGLPPTPIAAPGAAALEATARPAAGDELYFVASGKGDGSHRFSSTLAEHNRAVSAYLAALRRRQDGS